MEELKLILEAVANLGASGKEAFIWWLVFDKFLPGLMALIGLFGVGFTIYKLINLHEKINGVGPKLRDAMGIGCPGRLIDSELVEMMQWIKERRNLK